MNSMYCTRPGKTWVTSQMEKVKNTKRCLFLTAVDTHLVPGLCCALPIFCSSIHRYFHFLRPHPTKISYITSASAIVLPHLRQHKRPHSFLSSSCSGIDKETFLQYFPLNGLLGDRLFAQVHWQLPPIKARICPYSATCILFCHYSVPPYLNSSF